MHDGLRTLAGLVERIEAGGVVVNDVSLSRDGGTGGLDVDMSVRLPENGGLDPAEVPEDEGAPAVRGGATARSGGSPRTGPSGSTGRRVPAAFGDIAAQVGGPLAGGLPPTVDRSPVEDPGGDGPPSDGAAGGPAAPDADESARGAADPGESPDDARAGDEPVDDAPDAGGGSSDDEPVVCRVDGCEATFETAHGMKIHAAKAHDRDDDAASSPHRDPERLREVYDACGTFEEMTAALDVDVTPQTVRRNMMSLGIHDPDGEGTTGGDDAGTRSRDEGDDEGLGDMDARSAVAGGADSNADGAVAGGADPDAEGVPGPDATDGPDAALEAVEAAVPDAIDAGALVTAVAEASTLYEVQRRLDLEREAVQTLLAEFGLLEAVHGRVATEGQRDWDAADVERRIRERAASDEDGEVEGSDPADPDPVEAE